MGYDIEHDLRMSLEILADADAGRTVRCPECLWSETGGDRAAAKRLLRHIGRCRAEQAEARPG
jgi:hypothetical protein